MSLSNVTDSRSNSDENIAFAVRTIGRSRDREKVFREIYFGKKAVKTVQEISEKTGLSLKRVLEEGKKLALSHIVSQTKIDKRTAYEKDSFYAANKQKILNFINNPEKFKNHPSKRNSVLKLKLETIRVATKTIKAKQLYLEDLQSFSKVKKVKRGIVNSSISEAKFKEGIKGILNEKGKFTDWGGEKNDLLTTRVSYKGRRIATAFAFKGPGKKGKLVPGKMGKNGDQIQRLFTSPVQLFVLQYWDQIDETVYEQMQAFAKLKSILTSDSMYYLIIDGQDTGRIIQAYPSYFK